MSFGKRYCTCCETAYAEGLADGFKSGFKIGFERGHRSGYISGYVDAYHGREPLPAYKHEITPLIAFEKYEPPKLTDPGRLKCGCYWTCTCPPAIPSLNYFPSSLKRTRMRTGDCNCKED